MNPTSIAAARPTAAVPATRTALLALTESEQAVVRALRALRYGQVEVVVHSARIVQIIRSEKLRVDAC